MQAVGYALGAGLHSSTGRAAGKTPFIDDDDDDWDQDDLEDARDEQEEATRALENILVDLGNFRSDALSVETALAAYTPAPLADLGRYSPAAIRDLARGDYLSPLWGIGVAGISVGAMLYWHPTTYARAIAGLAALVAIVCVAYRQHVLNGWRNYAQDAWQGRLDEAIEHWRAVERWRRTQHQLAQEMTIGDPSLGNARACEIAIMRAALPLPVQLDSIQATAGTASIAILLPNLDEVIPIHRFVELKSGELSTRNIPAKDRGRMYRDFLIQYITRLAMECLTQVGTVERVELVGTTDYLDGASQTSGRVAAIRLVLDRNEAAQVSRTASGDQLAAQLDFTIGCTQLGELRPLRDQQARLPGAPIPMLPFVDESTIESPPIPEAPQLRGPEDAWIMASYLVSALSIAGLALALPDVQSATSAPPTWNAREVPPPLPAPTPARIVPAEGGLCGFGPSPVGVSSEAEWSRYACRSQQELSPGTWGRCLLRSAYTDEAGRGCPGAQRCCPP